MVAPISGVGVGVGLGLSIVGAGVGVETGACVAQAGPITARDSKTNAKDR